jgi:hypothetical protein
MGERTQAAPLPHTHSTSMSSRDLPVCARRSHLMTHDGRQGWVTQATQWVPHGHDMNNVPGEWPPTDPPTTYVIGADDWPGVQWPMSQVVDGTPVSNDWTGEGDWGQYWLGVGGTCADRSPPVG